MPKKLATKSNKPTKQRPKRPDSGREEFSNFTSTFFATLRRWRMFEARLSAYLWDDLQGPLQQEIFSAHPFPEQPTKAEQESHRRIRKLIPYIAQLKTIPNGFDWQTVAAQNGIICNVRIPEEWDDSTVAMQLATALRVTLATNREYSRPRTPKRWMAILARLEQSKGVMKERTFHRRTTEGESGFRYRRSPDSTFKSVKLRMQDLGSAYDDSEG